MSRESAWETTERAQQVLSMDKELNITNPAVGLRQLQVVSGVRY